MINEPQLNTSDSDNMSKSLIINHVTISPKIKLPIQTAKQQIHFKRSSSLTIPNSQNIKHQTTTPEVYSSSKTSNVHCGINNAESNLPSFVNAREYDEIPIKSTNSNVQMCEKGLASNDTQFKVIPLVFDQYEDKTTIRDKESIKHRKQFNLDSKADCLLSKTDSLAMFLKYEDELSSNLSEKELKDQSNSISKRSLALFNLEGNSQNQKLPAINMKSMIQPPLQSFQNTRTEECHSNRMKTMSSRRNLPMLHSSENSQSKSPPVNLKKPDESSFRRSGGNSALRRQMKYNIENILFDTDPEPSRTDSNYDSHTVHDRRNSNRTNSPDHSAILDDFDFHQFIASFNDDDQFPIFKEYKLLLEQSVKKTDAENNYLSDNKKTERSKKDIKKLTKENHENSDTDDNNSLEKDARYPHAERSKFSADSAYER
jgi:hypothetical protein